MYRHLLVPIDDTLRSAANVETSVNLARSLSARITFFHATADWGATDEGALMRAIDPALFAETVRRQTNALLAKAMAGARASNVDCNGVAQIGDRPAEAILEAAQRHGCDLIVMASRGARGGLGGWLHSSQTERLLRQAPVALLVTRVEAVQPLRPAERALGIIQDEHRSIAVVVQSMRDLVKEAVLTGSADRPSLERMVAYLYMFPEHVHHPKEERYLHRRLRERLPGSEAILAEVEIQHLTEGQCIDRVSARLIEIREGAAPDWAALGDAIERMAEVMLRHIGFEERTVLLLARQYLQEQDWVEIADAFATNEDPRYGDLPADEFRLLFTRIVNSVIKADPS
jgi:nucleotide-binding universal stress UspA family protein/hemerythrin-like domain-containing protein